MAEKQDDTQGEDVIVATGSRIQAEEEAFMATVECADPAERDFIALEFRQGAWEKAEAEAVAAALEEKRTKWEGLIVDMTAERKAEVMEALLTAEEVLARAPFEERGFLRQRKDAGICVIRVDQP